MFLLGRELFSNLEWSDMKLSDSVIQQISMMLVKSLQVTILLACVLESILFTSFCLGRECCSVGRPIVRVDMPQG